MPRSLLTPLTVLALAAGSAPAAADWTTFGGDPARTGFAAGERSLTPRSAAALQPAWRVDLGATIDAQPAVAGGLVVAATEHGLVAAIDERTGAIRWQRRLRSQKTTCRDLPGGRYGVSTTPVVQGGRVYVPAERGLVYALSLATGETAPGWPVRVWANRGERVWGAMALWRGLLYVPTASHCDNAYYRGEVAAVSIRKRRVVSRWYAVPRGRHGGGVWAWGGVAVDSARRRLYVATANAQETREDLGYAEHVVELSPGLRTVAANHPKVPRTGDADFGGHPMLIDASGCPPLLAVAHKTGRLLLYDRRRIARGPVQLVQAGDPRSYDQFGTYAWSPPQRTLYLANATDGPLGHGMVALSLGSDCRLHPRWRLGVDSSQYRPGPVTVTAGGLVVWGGGASGLVWMADAATGAQVRALGPLPQPTYAGVTVADGMVFVPAWDGRLRAWAPGAIR